MRALRFLPILLLSAACAGPNALEERSTSAVFPQEIGVVRGAAMSSLMRAGLHLRSEDASGSEQSLSAYGDGAEARVTLEALTPRSTQMHVSVLAQPGSGLLGRFVDGVEGVLGARR